MLRRLFSALFASASLALAAPPPADPAALASAIDAALVARDVGALRALVHADGLSPADLEAMEPALADLIPASGGARVTTDRWPDGPEFGRPRVAHGFRIELNHPPAGIIRVEAKAGRATITSTLPYAIVNGACLLVGARRTDLGWKGPPDRPLGFTFVEGFPPLPVAITMRYNASGVDLETSFTVHSGTIIGQHIEEFTITGLPENFKGRLVLREGADEIFRSEPLTGRSTFTYRRPAP
jgi:hypothetical protein